MLPNTLYTATITAEVQNESGTTMENNYIWSFTTGAIPDITLPTVATSDPLNNTATVALNKIVALTFSEAMTPSTVNSTTFTLMQGTTSVAGSVAYSGTTAAKKHFLAGSWSGNSRDNFAL